MLYNDLYFSQPLFQLGRILPHWLPVFLGSGLIWFLFVYIFYLAIRFPSNRLRIVFLGRAALSALICLVLTAAIAYFYFRPRPFVTLGFEPLLTKSPLDKSFPSDHAVVAWALAATAWQQNKKSGAWAVAAAVLIGLGRVLAGVHYVGDVLAGAGLGMAVAGLVFKLSANAAGWFHDGPPARAE